MPKIISQYSDVFSKMCHFVALHKSTHAITDVQDALVLRAIYLYGQPSPEQVRAYIGDVFGLQFLVQEVNYAIDRLQAAGLVEVKNAICTCVPKMRVELDAVVGESKLLEQRAKDEWFEQLVNAFQIPSDRHSECWVALQSYVSSMFSRHGIQTLEFLDPSVQVDDNSNTAGSILDDVVRKQLSWLSVKEGRQVVRSFLTTRSAARTAYVTQLLDGTFSFYALTADKATTETLRKNLVPMKILLDTNFIFGLLQLHLNSFVAVSQDLISVIKENDFPFQLYYHPLTIKEFNTVLEYSKRRLTGREWRQSLSRALLQAGFLSGIEDRYHQLNAVTKIDPNEFFTRYGNVERILAGYGIKIYNENYEPLLNDDETLNLISKYKQFLYPKEKFHNTLVHDIVLWRTLQRMRKRTAEPFNCGAMFLSCDYSFFNFDRKKLRVHGEVGSVILPNVFLQLLRPFVARTDAFDSRFVETFSLPEFRTIHSADSRALSRIAQTLALYSDVGEDLALKLLTDEALLSSVRDLDEDDPAIQPLVEEAIIQENQQLRGKLEYSAREAEEERARNVQMSAELEKTKQLASEHAEALSRAAAAAANGEVYRERSEALSGEVEEVRTRHRAEEEARVAAERLVSEREEELQAAHERIAELESFKRSLTTIIRLVGVNAVPAVLVLVLLRLSWLRSPSHPAALWILLLSGGGAIALVDYLLLRRHAKRFGILLIAWTVIAIISVLLWNSDWLGGGAIGLFVAASLALSKLLDSPQQ